MAFVVGPSRNKTVQAAFEGLRAADRAEKKEAKAKPADAEPVAVKKAAAKKRK